MVSLLSTRQLFVTVLLLATVPNLIVESRSFSFKNMFEKRPNLIRALQLIEQPLQWFSLDDGVMGGKSKTTVSVKPGGILRFEGTINTLNGGFCSIRSALAVHTFTTTTSKIRLIMKGDGKTYKLVLSDGSGGGPYARKPSWQADLPTENLKETDQWQETTIPLTSLLPIFAGNGSQRNETNQCHVINPTEIKQLGVMLSLKNADGSPNPPETFGTGTFPFSLQIKSIEIVE